MPGILFLCIHNAGRSQMAAGFAREISAGRVDVYSGGSEPADSVNPVAVGAMAEVGIDIAGFTPQRFTDELLDMVDVVVTMGCGDTCPFIPGKRYVDWPLDDPKGRPIEDVRRIRDEIKSRVEDLVSQL
jgi:protein-tyrosine-phosphatase